MRGLLILSTAAATCVASAANAQGTAAKPDSSCTKFSDGRVECRVYRNRIFGDSAFGNGMFLRMDSAMAKRAALGIELRATGTRRDTLGVFVEGVTPKGPAEAAGIVEGDRIASINGVDLRTPAGDIDDSYSNGMASHRLSREIQKLTPGARVALRVYSGGRFRDAQVVAGKASDVMRLSHRFNIGGPGGMMMQFGGPGHGMMFGPTRIRTLIPPGPPAVYEIDDGLDQDVPPVTADQIRELVAAAARDAALALKQLAADGVA